MSDYSLDDILAEFDSNDSRKKAINVDADDILNDIIGGSSGSGSKKRPPFPDAGKPKPVQTAGNTPEKKFPAVAESADTSGDTAAGASYDISGGKPADKPASALDDANDVVYSIRKEQLDREKRLAEKEKEENNKKQERRKEEDEFIASIEEENIRKANVKAKAEKKKAEREKRLQRDLEEKKRREEERKKAQEQKRLEDEQKAAKELEEKQKAEQEAKQAAELLKQEEEHEAAQREAEMLRAAQSDQSEKLFATKSIVIEDTDIELPQTKAPAEETSDGRISTAEIELEKTLRQHKIEADAHDLLIRESELEDPDDFLSALNPYDLGRKAELSHIIETIPSENLAGDTQVIAGNELKELAKASAKADTRSFEQIIDGSTKIMPKIESEQGFPAFDPDKTFELADDIREFIPKKDQGHDTKEIARKKTPEEEELLRTINMTLEQKRIEDKRDTAPLPPDTGPYDKITLPTRRVGISKDDLPGTGEIPLSDPELAERKAKELARKQKRRLSDFVLEDISDDDYDYQDSDDEDEGPDDGTGIQQDLYATHRSLRFRSVLLAALTLLLVVAGIVQNILTDNRIGLFGNELGFLSNNGIVYMNLVAGVIGTVLCGSVNISGISKLFKGKADCDSVCTVSMIAAIGTAAANLADTNDLQQGFAFIYVPAALFGLLFNSFGKLSMIKRARANYRFISSDAPKYYAEVIDGQSEASAFTRGILSELPYLVTMRKTELLTEFLRKSYCEDKADLLSRKLVPASLIAGVILGLVAYFMPNGYEVNGVRVLENNIYWSLSVMAAVICVMSPLSMMFMANNPLRRATSALARYGAHILGYTSAEEFGSANSVLVDASLIFPHNTVECMDLKSCRMQNSGNSIPLDTAIILAASIAVKTGSVMAGFFFDMLGRREDLLEDLDGCIYEDNMGAMGWYGTKRVMLGNRDHMKHHGIKIPELGVIAKYCRNGSETVYLAVNNELVTVFFVRLSADPAIRQSVSELAKNDIALVIKTTDSLITPGKISDLFDIEPGKVRIINSDLHRLFADCTRYTADGSSAFSCSGSFISLARGLVGAKKLLKDFSLSQAVLLTGVGTGLIALIVGLFAAQLYMFTPAAIIGWQLLWLIIMLVIQGFRKY